MRRLAIAAGVWIVWLPLNLVAIALVVLVALPGLNPSGHGNEPESVLPYIAAAVTQFLVAAAVTRLISRQVATSSAGAIYAGPIAVGLGAGFLAGMFANYAMPLGGVEAAISAGLIFPLVGALAGTFIPVRLTPLAAGACMMVVAVIALRYGSNR